MPVNCGLCDYKCRDNYNLRRHLLSHEEFGRKCRQCLKPLPDDAAAVFHASVCSKRYECYHCGKKMATKKSVKLHIEKLHVNPVRASSNSKRCSLCSFECSAVSLIEHHLKVEHRLSFEEQFDTFDRKEQFINWKENLERKTNSWYVIRGRSASMNVSSGPKVSEFHCHRDGIARIKPASLRKRSMRERGPNKSGYFCPARMRVQFNDNGQVFVKGIYKHVGHDFRVERLPLKKSFRAEVACQLLSKNVPFQEIIRRNRSNVPQDGVLSRECMLNIKDLHNISRDFNVERQTERDPDDWVSVEIWIDENPDIVRYSKLQGETDVNHPELKEDDFVLIIMNDTQIELLKRFGPESICMDGIQDTNGYHSELTTIMVLNGNKSGVPCAFLFSNRADSEIMSIFVEKIYALTGPISCEVFMSDVTEVCFDAWCSIMGRPVRRLFCTFHVNRAWAKHRSLIAGDKSYKDEIFQKLTAARVEKDIKTFHLMFASLLDDLSRNKQTADFGMYLQTYYASNVKCWAFCYRKNCGVNTSTHLERMHGVLQHEYMNGKETKRLDKAIHDVTSTLDDELLCRGLTYHKDDSKKLSDLRRRHRTLSTESNKMKMITWTDEEWIVISSDFSEVYTVQQISTSCKEEHCELLCEPCAACFHMFLCTCHDSVVKSNMCKHIHLVCSEMKKISPSNIIESSKCIYEIVMEDMPSQHSARSHGDVVAEIIQIALQAKTQEHLDAIHEHALSLKSIILSSDKDVA